MQTIKGIENTDERVVLSYKNKRNNRLLGVLLKKYKTNLFGLAYYYLNDQDLAMDAVMETYEVVIKDILQKEITYFKGWIMGICRNICLKKIRDQKKYRNLKEIADHFMENDAPTVYTNDMIDKLLKSLAFLKDHQRKCIEAFYFKNLSYREIAKYEGLSINEVKSYLQNGKRNLKKYYNNIPG